MNENEILSTLNSIIQEMEQLKITIKELEEQLKRQDKK
jgi:hypothetical protein